MCAYKVGMRVPESLLAPFTALTREQQVLRFLLKWHNSAFTVRQQSRVPALAKPFPTRVEEGVEAFQRYATLHGAPTTVLATYERHLKTYIALTPVQLHKALQEVQAAITQQKAQNTQLAVPDFTGKDLPTFRDPAHPLPSEISLHDYQFQANRSMKMIGAHLNQFAETHIDQLPTTRTELIQAAVKHSRIAVHNLERYPYKAASIYLKTGSNLAQMALAQMTTMMEVWRNMRDKVEFAKQLLFPTSDGAPDFSEHVPVLLSFYSVSVPLLKYLAATWHVELGWVRNTLVGWRRKIDPCLPAPLQIEPITALMVDLAAHCQKYAQSEDERKVIGRLQRKHLLHLLHVPALDLSGVLKESLQAPYQRLRRHVPPYPRPLQKQIGEHATDVSGHAFEQGAKTLRQRVQETLQTLPPGSTAHSNTKTFLKKVQLILKHWKAFRPLFQHYVPGNRFTSAVARLFSQLPPMKSARITRLFTALRGIMALTFAQTYPSATGQLQSVYTPDHCVTRPYQGKARKKAHLPANLLFNKYVVERQAVPNQTKMREVIVEEHGHKIKRQKVVKDYLSNADATEILKAGRPIWLGLPIYAPNQLVGNLIQGKKKGTFWFRLFASSKIRECLDRGAQIQDLRLNVPRGPTLKIVVDIILAAADPSAFQHRGQFMKALDRRYGDLPLPQGKYLGSDLNPLGGHMLALATTEQELDIGALMGPFQDARDRLERIRKKEIPNIQRKLDLDKGTPKQQGRWKEQLSCLHHRRQRIMGDFKRKALMIYLYMLYRTEAEYASWDGIQGLTPRGKRGQLPTEITYMPLRKGLYEGFIEWAADLQAQGYLPKYQETRVVSPYTSQVCSEHLARGQGMKRSRAKNTPYHDFVCTDPSCAYHGSRHSNSARVGALLLQKQVESPPLPLSTG
jgi:hypothetical protein